MLKVTIDTNTDLVAKLIDNLKKDIHTTIVPTGLDKTLKISIEELKSQISFIINEQIRFEAKTQDPQTKKDITIDTTAADVAIIQQLFGVNVAGLDPKDITQNLYNDQVAFVQNWGKPGTGVATEHVRVKIPANPTDTLDTIYNKAVEYFNNTIYIDTRGPKTRYFVLNSATNAIKPKIVCSTRRGIEGYEQLKKATRRRELEVEKGRDYSYWALKQSDLQLILNGTSGISIEITDIINSIKNGNYDQAKQDLSNKGGIKRLQNVETKIDDMQVGKNMSTTSESYTKVLNLINSLTFEKEIEKDKTTYILVALLEPNLKIGSEEIIEIIKKEVSIWQAINQAKWVDALIHIIIDSIKKNLKG